jgi:hypothetical protein
MLKSQKSQFTCPYCSKMFKMVKDPIDLPCDDSICRQHLSERDIVVKRNKIKCQKCKHECQVKDNHFKSNEALLQLIESQSYLNAEISLKHGLKMSIRKFFEFYDEFSQNRTQLESDVFDHFQEIRF